MSTPQIGSTLRAWYRWKALRLPWRKRFLVGLDLRGNTYWIFRDPLAPPSPTADPNETTSRRWRRIVKYPSSAHHSEVKVPPPWHQWLRHQREHPPSIAEQSQDVIRQEQMKVLAAEADARWEAKPSLLTRPVQGKEQPVPTLDTAKTQLQEQELKRHGAEVPTTDGVDAGPAKSSAVGDKAVKPKADPWKRATGPSETWQPEAWSPTSAKKS